jgi:glycerol kinase
VPDSGGVTVVPALSGLGAPHWRPEARGTISGLSFGTTRAHLVRAALEAMAHQSHDLMTAFAADGADLGRAQDRRRHGRQRLDRPGSRRHARPDRRAARFRRDDALGAAMLAGVGCGLFGSLEEASAMRGPVRQFRAENGRGNPHARLKQWQAALARALA